MVTALLSPFLFVFAFLGLLLSVHKASLDSDSYLGEQKRVSFFTVSLLWLAPMTAEQDLIPS